TRSGLAALNELCVKWRGEPPLIPMPGTTENTPPVKKACPPRPPPPAPGGGAGTPGRGPTPNTPPKDRRTAGAGAGSPPRGGVRGGRGPGLGGPVRRMSGTAVIVLLALLGRHGRGKRARRGAGCLGAGWRRYGRIRLRHRNLRSRKLGNGLT